MDVRVYEAFLRFNQGLDQALGSLDILEKLDLGSPSCIAKIRVNLSELCSSANYYFASTIAQKEQEEQNNFYRIRRNREKAEEGPNEIYFELKSREALRREQGLPPRAVILPWTQADDDRILAMQKAASSSLPTQPEQRRTISVARFADWASQFPLILRPIAAQLVRQIADRYFIGHGEFHRILSDLIDRSGIPSGHPVVFCRAEPLGKSSPRVAHAVKNQARWRPAADIDLSGDSRNWPGLRSIGVRHIILADDFVGSGTTLSNLFLQDAPLVQVLRANPDASLKVLVIAGFEAGLTRIKFSIPGPLLKRVQIISGRLFGPRDQCFELRSRILPIEEQRNNLRQFCQDAAAKHYPSLDVDSRLGFRALGALVVFPDTVPNNSLPILWHDRGTWLPLFPGSGLPGV